MTVEALFFFLLLLVLFGLKRKINMQSFQEICPLVNCSPAMRILAAEKSVFLVHFSLQLSVVNRLAHTMVNDSIHLQSLAHSIFELFQVTVLTQHFCLFVCLIVLFISLQF